MEENQKRGILYGVGVGPGDPELMTLAAVRIIRESDVIAVPQSVKGGENLVALEIAKKAVPELENKELLPISMPMTRDRNILEDSHRQGATVIQEQLHKGRTVAFLTLGDPSVYSTYIYIHKILLGRGENAVIIPGVPSFCAVAARLKDGLVEGSAPLHVIPASYPGTEEALHWKGTKVLMKIGKSIDQVREAMKEKGLLSGAKMIQNCGMENERIWENLEDFSEADSAPGYFSMIVVKGE